MYHSFVESWISFFLEGGGGVYSWIKADLLLLNQNLYAFFLHKYFWCFVDVSIGMPTIWTFTLFKINAFHFLNECENTGLPVYCNMLKWHIHGIAIRFFFTESVYWQMWSDSKFRFGLEISHIKYIVLNGWKNSKAYFFYLKQSTKKLLYVGISTTFLLIKFSPIANEIKLSFANIA